MIYLAQFVYLAGKITKRDWRQEAVNGLRCAVTYDCDRDAWPILERSIFSLHHYVGPFFVGCDHGCYHGPNTHGSDGGGCDGNGPRRREDIGQRCRQAIQAADLVYAWVDDPTAYGTILEIGYAVGIGCRVVVAHPPGDPFRRDCPDHNAEQRNDGPLADLWLLPQFLEGQPGAETLSVDDPITGLRRALMMPSPNVGRAVSGLPPRFPNRV